MAQQPALIGGRICHRPSPDQTMAPVDADMALVTKGRHSDVHLLGPVLPRLGLGELHTPARVTVLLAQLGGLVLPLLRDAAGLQIGFLILCVALARSCEEAGIDDLAGHRDGSSRTDRRIKAGEQRLNHTGLGQLLPKQPDRCGIRDPITQREAQETHEREPIVDEELGALVGESVLGLDDEDLEHHDGIARGPAALRAACVGQCRLQVRAEDLEVDHPPVGFQLIAEIAQPPQPLVNIEEPRLPSHLVLPPSARKREP
jgi:hypothetical protein